MSARIFIDGAAGTTGLEIRERLAGRGDLSVVQLADAERKDPRARAKALNEADLVVLCLPDDAAREAVSLIDNPSVRVIDASTAYRTAPGWVYGFPEMERDQRAKLAAAGRVSNPGCYATGFLALVRPLTRAGIVPPDFPLTVNAVSGYSGGGRAMIEEFEKKASPAYVETVVRTYALTLSHKHVPEMQAHAKLSHPPVFAPSVGRFYRGMMVEVPLQLWALPGKPTTFKIHEVLGEAYRGEKLIEVDSLEGGILNKALDAEMLKLTNGMKLFVFGNDKYGQVRLVALLDNLGKGAGGAAVQNLNLMLGLPETAGLV
ncbi:MAG: N-acetyl-gamma-glutamyl-phosphate reductase [Alphaproteobacteria bacterium]|nr:N-acetyl-gamma-glutamyl-phosphate reductase [Alphaproteobacteria bacterium]MDE2631144.1 N-acetyl-gamma-glutamyl-phosphate reductase [Alphaproteobacteria bacterium]